MLEQYLEEHYNISKHAILKSPIHDRIYRLTELLDVVKRRNTEANIIEKLEMYQIEDKEGVLMYLTGIETRFEIEKNL